MTPDLQIVAPSLIPGSGGHRTILSNALALSQLGVRVGLFLEIIEGPGTTLHEQRELAEALVSDISSSIEINMGWDQVDTSVPVMATAAQTARVLWNSAAKHKFYFLQDRESFFNPASSTHLNAELSYLTDAVRISIGNWIPAFLRRDYGISAAPTPFGVDHSVYSAGLGARRHRPRLAVLLQPDKPRRLTELLLEALGRVAGQRPDIDIVFFGSDHGVAFDHPAKHLGLLPEASVARLYASSSLGVCLSATNPSRVPFEMVASGLPALDILADNTLYDYPSSVRLVYPGAKSLAAAIISMIDGSNGYQYIAHKEGPALPSRVEETSKFAEIVLGVLDGREADLVPADPPQAMRNDYDLPPHPEEQLMAEQWLARARQLAAPSRIVSEA